MPRNFADRLLDAIDETQNPSCFGLDPVVTDLPPSLRGEVLADYAPRKSPDMREATAEAIRQYNRALIDATAEFMPIYKPNIAFYERYGAPGIQAFWDTVAYIMQRGRLVIADVKREDIGKTAKAYATGLLGSVEYLDGSVSSGLNADAVTLGPYLGSDSVGEFVKVCSEHGKGAFVLVKTSNPSSGELQDQRFADEHGGRLLFEQVALLVDQWGGKLKGERGYSSLGAVVGATFPEQAARAREMMENAIILVPGYGSQGGTAKDVVPNFNPDGQGAIVNNSSGLATAYKREPYKSKFGEHEFALATREAALAMRDDIRDAMRASGRLPQGW